MWMSRAEADAIVAAMPDATIDDSPQGQIILAVYPEAELGAFNGETPETWACIFAPIIMEGDRWVTYVFVNNEGKVVGVFISGP